MSKYGWYPVSALAGAIIVSKELIRVNEDIFLAINAALIGFAFYVGLGGTVSDMTKTTISDENKYYNNLTQFELSLIEEAIRVNDAAIAKPEVFENYINQYEQASSHYQQAQKLIVQLALRNSVEAKLQGVKDRELRAERDQKDKLAKGARAWLMNKFQSSPQLRQAAIERALQNIGRGTNALPDAQDPIKQLFRDYVAEARRTVK